MIDWKKIMQYRETYFGICALWIVLFHIHNLLGKPSVFAVSRLISLGNMGVDVFLFLSAIGLSYSVEENSLKQFYYNRIIKVFIPFVIITFPFYLWLNFYFSSYSNKFVCFFLDMTSLSYWLREDYALWYVSFILVMYAIYPFLYFVYKRNKKGILMVLVASVITEIVAYKMDWYIYTNCERALSRIPVFLTGLMVSDYVKRNVKINLKHIIASTGVLLALMYILFNGKAKMFLPLFCIRYIYGICAVLGVIVVGYLFCKLEIKIIKPFINIFCFLGKISFEIYVIHVVIIRIIRYNKLIEFP